MKTAWFIFVFAVGFFLGTCISGKVMLEINNSSIISEPEREIDVDDETSLEAL